MAKTFNGQAIQFHIAKTGEEAYLYFEKELGFTPQMSKTEKVQALIMYCADLNKEIAALTHKERNSDLEKFNAAIACQTADAETPVAGVAKVKKHVYSDLITKKITFERKNKDEQAKRRLKENAVNDQFNSNVVRSFVNDCVGNTQDQFVHFDISTGLPTDTADNSDGNISDETLNEVFADSVHSRKCIISHYRLFYQAAAATEWITDGEIGYDELKHLADCYYTQNNGIQPTRFKAFIKFFKALQLGLKYDFESTESMLKEFGLDVLATPGALKKLVKGYNAEWFSDKDIFLWGEDDLITARLEEIKKKEEEHRKLLAERRYQRKLDKEAKKAVEASTK